MTAPAVQQPKVIRLSGVVNFTPKQQVACEAVLAKRFILYGGARGGGKSYWLRWMCAILLIKWFVEKGMKGVRVGLFCETYPALKDRHLSVAKFPEWLGTWNKTDHEFTLAEEFGGGVICFRNLDNPDKYRSVEFAAIAVDELTLNPITVFNDLRGSLRWPGIDHTPFFSGSNPTGIGHSWVKDIWVEQTFQMDETRNLLLGDPRSELEPYTKDDFAYIPALVTDNPHNSPEYVRSLMSLSDRMRAAFLYGSWDHFEGMAFEEWDRTVHVVPNRVPPRSWHWVAGMDWGFRRGAYYLCAISPDADVEVVWEFYFSKLHAKNAAIIIANRSSRFPVPEVVYGDDQMWQQTGAVDVLANEYIAGLLESYGNMEAAPKLIPALKGKGSRAAKYNLMKRYLTFERSKDGTVHPWQRPRLSIQERCLNAIRTIPSLPVDPDAPEDDVDTDAEDHCYDAICNVLMAQPRPPEKESTMEADQHPGIDPVLRRRAKKPWEEDEDESWLPERRALRSLRGSPLVEVDV